MNWISIEKVKPNLLVSCLFRYEAHAESYLFTGFIDKNGCIVSDEGVPDYVIDSVTHFAIISDFINLNI